jgi:hypothetical protein
MAIVQRPAKQGGATTYQGKVALNYTKILASEADADLDTIYAAWNGGADTVNLRDYAVTNVKLASDSVDTRVLAAAAVTTPELADLSVTTLKLADAAVTNVKLASDSVDARVLAPATITTAELADGAVTTPKLANGAVRGSAGAAQHEILLRSIYGDADIAEGSLTRNLIAAGQTIRVSTVAIPPGNFAATANQWTRFVTASPITLSGGTFLAVCTHSLAAYVGGLAEWQLSLAATPYGSGAALHGNAGYSLAGGGYFPLPPIVWVYALTGAQTFYVDVWVNRDSIVNTATGTGALYVIEWS